MENMQDKILWHYCSSEAFISIIQNGEIWLSNPFYSNDSQEQMHVYKVAVDYIIKNLSRSPHDDDAIKLKLLRSQINRYERWHRLTNIFTFSLTSLPDNLGQWARYTKNGKGFSIGFCERKLREFINTKSKIDIETVAYEIDEVIIDYLLECMELLNTKIEEVKQSALDNLEDNFRRLGGICKHPSFTEEQEIRLIYDGGQQPNYLVENKDIRSKVIDSEIRNFVSINIKNANIIDKIMIGPSLRNQEHDIRILLASNGFGGEVGILRSESTLRV
jgi:hypothetical protein